MKRELLVGMLMLLLSGTLYWGVMQIDGDEASLMPFFVVVFLVILSVVHIAEMYIKHCVLAKGGERAGKKEWSAARRGEIASLIITFISMVVFIFLLDKLGFYATCYLYMLVFPAVLVRSERSLKATLKRAATSALFMGALYVLFNQYMVMQTPKGVLF